MAKKKTHEQFIEEMKIKHPNIKVVSTYINRRTKVTCECLVCNNQWNTLPSVLLRGCGCSACGVEKLRNKRLSNTEEFLEKLASVNSNVELLLEYISAKEKVTCKCKVCGNEFKMAPNSLLSGRSCPKCALKKRKTSQLLSEEEFLERLKKLIRM